MFWGVSMISGVATKEFFYEPDGEVCISCSSINAPGKQGLELRILLV